MKSCILVLFVFLFSSALCEAQDTLQCQIVASLLGVKQINEHLKLDSKAIGYIRILDQSDMFENCTCKYKNFFIKTIENVPLDFNTGRYIDLAILSAKREGSVITLEVFYALSGQSDDYANLFMGTIRLVKTEMGIEVKKVNIGNVQ